MEPVNLKSVKLATKVIIVKKVRILILFYTFSVSISFSSSSRKHADSTDFHCILPLSVPITH